MNECPKCKEQTVAVIVERPHARVKKLKAQQCPKCNKLFNEIPIK